MRDHARAGGTKWRLLLGLRAVVAQSPDGAERFGALVFGGAIRIGTVTN